MRKLASIRQIYDIKPHTNADALELAIVDGWQCVVKKGEFIPGDLIVYFEVDSVLPVREEFEFLRKSCYVKKEWLPAGEGFRLRTIKLRGELSQGLVLHLGYIDATWENKHKMVDADVTEFLGVVKWDPPVPAHLDGQVKGTFPSFIPKTDQERAQNLTKALASAHAEGDLFEVTMKLDGSSATYFFNKGEYGACSRKQQLKLSADNADNTFVRMFHETGLADALLEHGKNVAVQCELMGPGIQGNREKFNDARLYVYDVYDIDNQEYYSPSQREQFWQEVLVEYGVKVYHVPVIGKSIPVPATIDELLDMARGPSLNHAVREGLVFKRIDGGFSFKIINNEFLLDEK